MPDKRRDNRDGTPARDLDCGKAADSTALGKRNMQKRSKEPDGFKEPELQDKPSWDTAIGVAGPYGVMSDMQALGELPNAKVKSRVKTEPVKKNAVPKGWATVGVEGQETSEATPEIYGGSPLRTENPKRSPTRPIKAEDEVADSDPNDHTRARRKEQRASASRALKRHSPETLPNNHRASQSPIELSYEQLAQPAKVDDELDEDYAPGGRSVSVHKEKQKKNLNHHRGSTSKTSKRQTIVGSDAAPPPPKPPPTRGPDRINQNKVYKPAKLKRVVECAVERAHSVGKPELGDAVQEIWRQSLSNRRLTELLEIILTNSASPELTEEFQTHVRRVKKELKKARESEAKTKTKQEEPETPATGANGSQALPLRSPPKPTGSEPVKPATLPNAEPADASRPKVTLKVKSPHKHKHRSHRHSSQAGKSSTKSPHKHDKMENGDDTSSLSSLTSNSDADDNGDSMDYQNDGEIDGATPGLTNSNVEKKPAHRDNLRISMQDRNLKRSSMEADLPEDERDRILAAKKQKLEKTVARDYAYQESDIRGSPEPPVTRTRSTRTRNSGLEATDGRNTNSRNSRAISIDLDSPLSEVSHMSSRRSSPHVWKGPPKAPGKRAKTKTSPEKKQVSAYGGMSGAGGASRASPIGNDDNEELSENNDYCSACGGSGFLLCCDGCDRSFHFTCLDPPLNENASELNEPWFCFICVAKRPVSTEQPEKPTRGLFAPLINSINKRNPSTFSLPQDLRDYFEGVATDRTGTFLEAVNTKSRKSVAYDELPDYQRTRDAKNNFILCYQCGKSSQGRRSLIMCDYCGQYWHLDCLDPPLANAPARSLEGKKLNDWMCPLHADHELRKVDANMLTSRRKVHIRRPRNAKVIETSLNRGFINNGIIDVVHDSSDESSSEFEEDEGESVVYRLPAHGIKLDFIDRIKQTRIQKQYERNAAERARRLQQQQHQNILFQSNFSKRSFAEQQAALNLAQFASANGDLNLGRDQVQNLVGTLIAEAPPEVVAEISLADNNAAKTHTASSAIPPSPPVSEQPDQLSAEQRQELLMLQELIRRRLESSKT